MNLSHSCFGMIFGMMLENKTFGEPSGLNQFKHQTLHMHQPDNTIAVNTFFSQTFYDIEYLHQQTEKKVESDD